MKNEVFLDLTKILENDEDYIPEAYYRAVMDGGIHNGRQYLIPLLYSAPLFMGNEGELDRVGFDKSSVTDAASLFDEVSRCLPYSTENPIFKQVFVASFSMQIKELFTMTGIRLLDYENDVILPDEDVLRRYLETAAACFYASGEDFDVDTYRSWMELWTGELWFDDIMYLTDIAISINELKKNNYGYESLMLESPHGGVSVSIACAAGIRANSPNSENAYNFIKIISRRDFQNKAYADTYGSTFGAFYFPVLREVIKPHIHTAFSGKYSIEKEEKDVFINYPESITHASFDMSGSPLHVKLWDIMRPYFIREASLDDCMEELRNFLPCI